MEAIRGIIFDFGHVLTDHNVAVDLLAAYDRQLGWPTGTLRERLYRGRWWEQVSLGEISETVYFQGAVGDVIAQLPVAFQAFRHGPFAVETLRPEVVALVQGLRRTCRLALLSNASPSLRRQLIRWPHVLECFETVVISAEVGLRKPDPRIYQMTLRNLQLRPDEVLFVDDKVRNTEGAAAVGIESVLFESPSQLREELAARGLLELLKH